jgi:hypothetical protein
MSVDTATSIPPKRPSRPRRAPLPAIFLLLPIALLQLWISTAGWVAWSRGSQYISLLADAFMHGQLSLMVTPPPQRLALPDPYDPQANSPYRLHDATLFHG